jgi:hypothetical protein
VEDDFFRDHRFENFTFDYRQLLRGKSERVCRKACFTYFKLLFELIEINFFVVDRGYELPLESAVFAAGARQDHNRQHSRAKHPG